MDQWTVGPITVWPLLPFIYPAAIQWTVEPMDCRTNGLYGSWKFVTAIHPAAVQ